MNKNKNKMISMLLFMMLVVWFGQFCYGENEIDLYDPSKAVPIKKGVLISSAGVGEGGVKVEVEGIVGTKDLQKISFKVTNNSGGEFELARIVAHEIFDREDYKQENLCSDRLFSGQSCIYSFTGTLDWNKVNSDSYLDVRYYERKNQDKLMTKKVRPWNVLHFKQRGFDFSRPQKCDIKNVFPDRVGVISIKIIGDRGRGRFEYKKGGACDIIESDNSCDIDIPKQDDSVKRLTLSIKFKIDNELKEERVELFRDSGNGFQETLVLDKSTEEKSAPSVVSSGDNQEKKEEAHGSVEPGIPVSDNKIPPLFDKKVDEAVVGSQDKKDGRPSYILPAAIGTACAVLAGGIIYACKKLTHRPLNRNVGVAAGAAAGGLVRQHDNDGDGNGGQQDGNRAGAAGAIAGMDVTNQPAGNDGDGREQQQQEVVAENNNDNDRNVDYNNVENLHQEELNVPQHARAGIKREETTIDPRFVRITRSMTKKAAEEVEVKKEEEKTV